jgi:hypothetical protein
MVTEGASGPTHSIPMTVNPILSNYCETKPTTTTTNERMEGENDQSKAAFFLPTILNSYVHPWYPTYVSDTTVHECASKFSTHHLHTTASYCTVPDSTGITGSDSSDPNFNTATVTNVMVTTRVWYWITTVTARRYYTAVFLPYLYRIVGVRIYRPPGRWQHGSPPTGQGWVYWPDYHTLG